MEVKCDYCGGFFEDTLENCTHCGAQNNHIRRVTDTTPKTIKELEQWYKDRNLPPYEVTRFFIGINYTEPRAFGIYEENGKFIVYKNKDNGQRAIRYEGTDEAYAVNELYLKLKSEILNQKANQGPNGTSTPANRKRSAKDGWLGFGITGGIIGAIFLASIFDGLVYAALIGLGAVIILGIVLAFAKGGKYSKKIKWPVYLAVFLVVGTIAYIPLHSYLKTRYYNYNNNVYCYYQGDYYQYYDNDYWPVEYSSLPADFTDNKVDYEYNWNSEEWNDRYDFESSDYYYDNFSSSSDSDSSYDWSSSDSWDSGGSDWSSDWLRPAVGSDYRTR